MELKPASLPPIVKLTRVVEELSVDSWLSMTSGTVAPAKQSSIQRR
jgi:hypothetical protein